MTQTTKRGITIFPLFRTDGSFQTDGSLQTDGSPTGPTSLGMADAVAPAALVPGRDHHFATAVITARGQRFSLRQIGSMFGSE